jgi:hypothetical protein
VETESIFEPRRTNNRLGAILGVAGTTATSAFAPASVCRITPPMLLVFQVTYRPFYLWTKPTLDAERKNLKLDGL